MNTLNAFWEHPLSASAIFLIVVALFYILFYIPRRKKTFDFDLPNRYGSFEQHAKRYQALARIVLTLATASVAFLLNFLVGLPISHSGRSIYSLKLESASPQVIVLLCLSATCSLLFLLLQNLFYEDYAHSKYTDPASDSRETYTGARYALVLTLVGACLFSFFGAYLLLAFRLFT